MWFSESLSLRMEITLIIIFKLFFIMLLWYVCFSAPSQHALNHNKLYHRLTMPQVVTGGKTP